MKLDIYLTLFGFYYTFAIIIGVHAVLHKSKISLLAAAASYIAALLFMEAHDRYGKKNKVQV